MHSKQQLRKAILQLRDELSAQTQKERSREITNRVLSHAKFQEAEIFLLFLSFRSEVNTAEIIEYALETGKPVYLPKVLGKEMEFYRIFSLEDLHPGYQGIREPEASLSAKFTVQKEKRVFVLLPGAVFDKAGGRIGYGGGYYDKFLQKLKKEIPAENLCNMAVAFECQIVDVGVIASEEHDVKPDYIVTEEATYDSGIYKIIIPG